MTIEISVVFHSFIKKFERELYVRFFSENKTLSNIGQYYQCDHESMTIYYWLHIIIREMKCKDNFIEFRGNFMLVIIEMCVPRCFQSLLRLFHLIMATNFY
jgi:hypothetical protein